MQGPNAKLLGSQNAKFTRKVFERPWTSQEIRAREQARNCLESARALAQAGNREMATINCLVGLSFMSGHSAPFAVRDQIHDLLTQVDPDGELRQSIVIE